MCHVIIVRNSSYCKFVSIIEKTFKLFQITFVENRISLSISAFVLFVELFLRAPTHPVEGAVLLFQQFPMV